MSEHTFGPPSSGASTPAPYEPVDHDEVYRAPHAPISVVPSAARDYAELHVESPPERDTPIELGQVPDAPASYEPERVYEDVPEILPVEEVLPTPETPIDDVPLIRAVTPVTPDEVIAEIPVTVAPVVQAAPPPPPEPVVLIEGVPDDIPPQAPIQAAEPVSPALAPKTPWWKLLVGGS